MTIRGTLALIAALVALCSNSALAESAGDLEGVNAASRAFFSALGVIDCVFRTFVTARSGIVTGDFGIVTGRSGIVTDGISEGVTGCV